MRLQTTGCVKYSSACKLLIAYLVCSEERAWDGVTLKVWMYGLYGGWPFSTWTGLCQICLHSLDNWVVNAVQLWRRGCSWAYIFEHQNGKSLPFFAIATATEETALYLCLGFQNLMSYIQTVQRTLEKKLVFDEITIAPGNAFIEHDNLWHSGTEWCLNSSLIIKCTCLQRTFGSRLPFPLQIWEACQPAKRSRLWCRSFGASTTREV